MPIIVEGILVSRVGTLFRKKSVFPLLSYEIILNIYSTSRLKSNSVTHGLKRLRTTTAFPNVTLTHNVWQRTWFMEDKKKKKSQKHPFCPHWSHIFVQAPLDSWHLLKSKVNLNHAMCHPWRGQGEGLGQTERLAARLHSRPCPCG